MTAPTNRRWLLAERPTRMCEDRHFRWVEEPVPELEADGEILVRNLYLSLDPTQRGWISRDTYLPAVAIGEVVRSGGVGRVVQSRNPAFAVGDLVQGLFGWQDYARIAATGAAAPDQAAAGRAHPARDERARPHRPHRVLRSARRGQAEGRRDGGRLGRRRRHRVGRGPDRAHQGLPRHRHRRRQDEVRLARPGGPLRRRDRLQVRGRRRAPEASCARRASTSTSTTSAATCSTWRSRASRCKGRIVLCGAIAAYNDAELRPGPKNYMNLIIKRGRMEGFLVFDYMSRAPRRRWSSAAGSRRGQMVNQVDVKQGLENAPAALRRLFAGENIGKQLLKIAD